MSLRARYLLFALALVLAAVFVRLGIWQLSRLHQRRSANAGALKGRAASPVDLNQGAPGTAPNLVNRWVVVRGVYDREHEVVLRGHVYQEAPGIEVVTPLRIEGRDDAILVNRGFVPSPDAVTAAIDELNEPGIVTVHGLALPIPASSDSGAPLANDGKVTWRRLDLPALRARSPYPIESVYLLQNPDSALPHRPIRQPAPPLDDGPHLSYAIQWFAFALIAVAGGGILALRQAGPAPVRAPPLP